MHLVAKPNMKVVALVIWIQDTALGNTDGIIPYNACCGFKIKKKKLKSNSDIYLVLDILNQKLFLCMHIYTSVNVHAYPKFSI